MIDVTIPPRREGFMGCGDGREDGPRMGLSKDWEVTISPSTEPFSVESFEHHKWLHRGLLDKSPCAGGNSDM